MRSPLNAIPLILPRQPLGTVSAGFRVVEKGAAYVGITLLSIILWLPMKLLPVILVFATVAQLAMAYTKFIVAQDILGGCMSLMMIAVIFFVAGALIQFRAWLVVRREMLRWS